MRVVANDATVKGGSYYPLTVKKHLRAQEVAAQNRLPCVYLVDSGGAFLPLQADVFPDREHFGRIFYNQAHALGGGHPADRGGDGLVHRGRRLRAGDVGRDGDRARHGDDLHRRPAAREGRDRAGRDRGGARRRRRARAPIGRRRPLRDVGRARPGDLPPDRPAPRRPAPPRRGRSLRPSHPRSTRRISTALIPEDFRYELDPLEIIARIVDGSRFAEFKALYGDTLVCGFARIEGHPVAILANRGVLFAESAQKGAHFVELACKRRVPLLFLQNITGFMVGKEYEEGGIARDGAKLVTAVACAAVPKFTVVTGGSFGAGNYAMCGRAYGPRQLWMWPNARISVMGGEQAATVLSMVGNADPDEIRETYEREGDPYYSTARLWDDGIVDPLDTRRVLALGLAAAANAPVPETTFGIFRM